MLLHILKHFGHLDIGAAVLWPFQRCQCRHHGRISVGTGRRDDPRGKRGVVAAAVLGVQHQRKVQHAGFELGKRTVRAQHLQNIFCGGKLGLRRADDQRFVVMVIGVCLIAVHRQHREQRDQL
ncbi:hypothetical protein SDC9_109965 [bioreactor metagenome]|uniref:Uncharacterized protein n=1 Tax=bioreactor metagenome TaxID=1076179 RepID=A0A645BCB4_9ZZZZ